MIYSNMLKPKYRNLLRAFILFLVAIFSLSLYSCQTTWTEIHSPDILRIDDDVKILNVRTTSDSTIYLADYNAKYYEKFNDDKDVIAWEKTDTIYIKSEPKKEFKLQNKISTINLRDILYANVEKENLNVSKTLLFTGLIAAAIFLVAIVISITSFKISPFHWHSSNFKTLSR